MVRARALSERSRTPAGPPCAACGAQLESDQEWCVECGAARTLLHRSPDWRAAVAIVAVVVGILAIAGVIVLAGLPS
jgi:predicted nucleic acid-binding Zn ribbon protein